MADESSAQEQNPQPNENIDEIEAELVEILEHGQAREQNQAAEQDQPLNQGQPPEDPRITPTWARMYVCEITLPPGITTSEEFFAQNLRVEDHLRTDWSQDMYVRGQFNRGEPTPGPSAASQVGDMDVDPPPTPASDPESGISRPKTPNKEEGSSAEPLSKKHKK